eukprot:6193795-Pleurochrysis_carterae.AAC.3
MESSAPTIAAESFHRRRSGHVGNAGDALAAALSRTPALEPACLLATGERRGADGARAHAAGRVAHALARADHAPFKSIARLAPARSA